MANAWNELYWGDGFWGLQGDGGASVTGIELSAQQGSVFSGENNSWGQYTWGFNEWGDLINPNVDLTGVELNTSVGNEEAFTNIDLILSTNLIESTTGTVFAASNFEIDVTGTFVNSTVNSIFAGEVVTVEVTAPGNPTTWGYESWGSSSWGQITGSVSQLGEETIQAEQNPTVDLIGNELNSTTDSLIITADAILTLSTNILNVTTGTAELVENRVVEVNSPGDLPWGITEWGYGSWGNIGGMDVEQGGEEVVVPSVEVDVSGNSLVLTLTSIAQVTGDANITADTNLINISLGDEEASPNTIVNLSTNLLNISVNDVFAGTTTFVFPTGVLATTNTGRLFISAWAVVDIGVTNTWAVVDIAA
jgi:hypothetical protein